jgi:SAM-dependent methyltransferase
MNGIRRSLALFEAFRHEGTDPETFYRLLADDTVSEVSRYCQLNGATVLDVGGASGYVADSFRDVGARSFTVEYDPKQMTEHGPTLGERRRRRRHVPCPFATGSVDISHSSNVLEHVAEPTQMLSEMVRVVSPRWGHLPHLHQLALPLGRPRDLTLALRRRRVGGQALRAQLRCAGQEPLRVQPVPAERRRGDGVV